MTELAFTVVDVAPERYAVSPQLVATVHLTESTGTVIHAIALNCQVRIHPQRRGYDAQEEAGLRDLFGPRERWGTTLQSLLWLQCSTMVQGFSGETEVALPLACTLDFDVAAAKYLHALRERTVPIEFLFSGTIFTEGERGFSVERVPWNCDAPYQLPVPVWRQLMDQFFPNSGWIVLDRTVLDELAAYRAAHGLTSWDAAVTGLLAANLSASNLLATNGDQVP